MKPHNNLFTLDQCKFIYEQAKAEERRIAQWNKIHCYDLVTKHYGRLEALVELLENILVFHVGNGVDKHGKVDNNTIHKRMLSIGKSLKS